MHLLVIAGAAIVIVLGVAHALLTLKSSPAGGPLAPSDPNVRASMSIRGGLGMAPDLDIPLWQAWAGFNLSHALGVVLGGLVIMLPALADFDAALANDGWLAVALAVPPLYLAISIRYWFRRPTNGIALATLLIGAGVIGGLLT